MVTSIIFDFFGVFRTDSYKAWLVKNGYERTGVFAEASTLSDQGKIDGDEFYRRISLEVGRTITPEEVDSNAVLNKETVVLARLLRSKYQIALLSNSPSDFVRRLLEEHSLENIFDYIFISGETGLVKPSADAFEYALATMNSTVQETIFIDDNPNNVEAARQLGITGYTFTSVDRLIQELRANRLEF